MKKTTCFDNRGLGMPQRRARRETMVLAALLFSLLTVISIYADTLYDGSGNMVRQSGITGGGHIAVAGDYTLVGAVSGASGPLSTMPSGHALFHGIPGPLFPENEGETHPGDLNGDWRMVLSEAIAYLAGWQQGSNPIGYAIRAAYLWQNGENYIYIPEEDPPLCWELADE